MQKFETRELKQKIAQSFESIAQFCECAGIEHPEQFENDLEAGDIGAQDIIKAVNALKIPPQEIGFYFFRTKDNQSGADFNKMLNELTPENREKLIKKYFELVAKQAREV